MRASLPHGIAFLLVDGDRVVALGVDAVVVEELQQGVALCRLLRLDHVEVVDVAVAGRLVGQREGLRAREARGVARRPLRGADRSTRRCASA